MFLAQNTRNDQKTLICGKITIPTKRNIRKRNINLNFKNYELRNFYSMLSWYLSK